MRQILALAALVAFAGPVLADGGPSFDCAKAQSKVEQALCADGNGTIGSMDGVMGRLYKALKAQGGHDDVLAGQSAWIRQRDKCGDDINCISAAYIKRLAVLAKAAGDANGITGNYSYRLSENDTGSLWVVREPDGTLAGGIDTVSSPAFHTCTVSFDGAQANAQGWTWTGPADEAGGSGKACHIAFRRSAGMINVNSSDCDYYCGARGFFDQSYKKD